MMRKGLLIMLLGSLLMLGAAEAGGQMYPGGPVPQSGAQWIPVPGAGSVYYDPHHRDDVFRYGKEYYYYHQNRWHRGPRAEGPWEVIQKPPRAFYDVGAPYYKTPPGWAKGKKTGWGTGHMPPGQMKKLDKHMPPGQMKKHGNY